jgi:hypothetical protein
MEAAKAEEQMQRWLESEQQEWARLHAGKDQHLVGEQPSQAKESAEERLAIRWHLLPTPYLFEIANIPHVRLAQSSSAEIIALMEQNLKKKRIELQRNQERQGQGGAPPQESELETIQVVNALLDWCRSELFPFLIEVDARIGANNVARVPFLYEALLLPLYKFIQQKHV